MKPKPKGEFMPKSDLVPEHTRLVGVLENPTKPKLKKELAKQSKELKKYKRI